MEQLYGAENFAKLWSDWVGAYGDVYKANDGDICKADLKSISAPTLLLHGAKDPMVAAEHAPYLMRAISPFISFQQLLSLIDFGCRQSNSKRQPAGPHIPTKLPWFI